MVTMGIKQQVAPNTFFLEKQDNRLEQSAKMQKGNSSHDPTKVLRNSSGKV